MKIRPATAAELPDILGLHAQPDMDDGAVLGVAEAEALHARFALYPDYTLYSADLGGRVVGTFSLLVMDKLGHLGAPSAIVDDVIVAADMQGGGIGRAMMEEAARLAREKGCYKLTLSSNMKREKAHAFYDAIGFERHGYSFRLNLERSEP